MGMVIQFVRPYNLLYQKKEFISSANFLHADCEAVIFVQISIVFLIFDFKMSFYYTCTCWTRSSSWNGPMKQSLLVLSSCCLLGCLSGIGSFGFCELRHVTKKPYQVVYVRCFGKTFFASRNWGNGPKRGQKQGFLNLKKKLGINFP